MAETLWPYEVLTISTDEGEIVLSCEKLGAGSHILKHNNCSIGYHVKPNGNIVVKLADIDGETGHAFFPMIGEYSMKKVQKHLVSIEFQAYNEECDENLPPFFIEKDTKGRRRLIEFLTGPFEVQK